MESLSLSRIGLAGLALMGQNLALNIAEKGFPISVYNRTASKVDETVDKARNEGFLPLTGHYNPRAFVLSLQRPRAVIILDKAGAPVDQTIAALYDHLEPGDCIIDGSNEWFENTERRISQVANKGLLYLGMGVSGGENGARYGPSLMPGGSQTAYTNVQDILLKIAAQVEDGPCVSYIGEGGSGHFVKMVHDGMEYAEIQLISEAYDVLTYLGGLSNLEIADIFAEWNGGELESFLFESFSTEITANYFNAKDEDDEEFLADKVLAKLQMKGTERLSEQQVAELAVECPLIRVSFDCMRLRALKKERLEMGRALMEAKWEEVGLRDESGRTGVSGMEKKKLIDNVRHALYASKISNYAQGMRFLRAKSKEKGWNLNLGQLARIWKGRCITRTVFLDMIKNAYQRNPNLATLIADPEVAREMVQRLAALRQVVLLATSAGCNPPGMTNSLGYFDRILRRI